MNKKVENIIKLSAEQRYSYFIKKVADFEEVWGLYDNGWAIMKNDEQQEVLPFWPEKEFAAVCAESIWGGYKPQKIILNDFVDKWLEGMIKDSKLVGVFLIPNGKGIIVEPKKLMNDIEDELDQYR